MLHPTLLFSRRYPQYIFFSLISLQNKLARIGFLSAVLNEKIRTISIDIIKWSPTFGIKRVATLWFNLSSTDTGKTEEDSSIESLAHSTYYCSSSSSSSGGSSKSSAASTAGWGKAPRLSVAKNQTRWGKKPIIILLAASARKYKYCLTSMFFSAALLKQRHVQRENCLSIPLFLLLLIGLQ